MLGFLAAIYKRIIVARNRRFDDGSTPAHALGVRTVSVGNLTTGGTGKTPLVIKITEILAARGKRVCILTRGYGRQNAKARILVSDGKKVLASVEIGGDEPVEMAHRLLGKAVVVADADRVKAAEWAREEFGVNVFVLDDAFQHRHAKRDVDIVCIDALDPFGGGKMMPAGRLREPIEGLARADAIVITRSDLAGNVAALKAEIAGYAPNTPIFTASTKIARLTDLKKFLGDNGPGDYSSVSNAKGFAFCGLGNPQVFFDQLKRDNYDIAGELAFKDHYKYSQKDVAAIQSKAKAAGATFLLTTAKDAVKLADFDVEMPCFVIEIAVVLNDEAAFAALL